MLAAFTDQAHNLILLAEDEARMLGQPLVDPEHLLLALTRHGRVRSLFEQRGVMGSDVFAAIVSERGLGDELVLGRVPRSPTTEAALLRAIDVAAERGVLAPSSQHLLLALAEDTDRVTRILEAVGILDVEELVDSIPGDRRPPVSEDQLRGHLLRLADRGGVPRPGPVPPVFERYTAEAHRAVRAGIETAALLEHHHVEPLHLLLGCLHASGSLAARVLDAQLESGELGLLGEAMKRALIYGPAPAHQATGIFSEDARWVTAEGALSYAYRHDDVQIGTGHLVLAILDVRNDTIDRIVGNGAIVTGPILDRLGRALTRALPGDEIPANGVHDEAIAVDVLTRILTNQFRHWLPPGWTIYGSPRASGFHLKVPDSRSEVDYQIDVGRIVSSARPARERLLEVTRAALAALQRAVCETEQTNWPPSGTDTMPEPHAEIGGDEINPTLRLWYGPENSPILELAPPPLLNGLLHS